MCTLTIVTTDKVEDCKENEVQQPSSQINGNLGAGTQASSLD